MKMQRSHPFLVVVLLISTLSLWSQNETNKWYFGNTAGLDFMTNPPTILTNGALSTIEGCATISDAAGNLLFYTNGITVWNQTHVAMANGTGLSGNSSSSQSAIIAKQPGNTNIYYIFTQSGPGVGGAAYSIVDMNLAAGMGSVTTKNFTLSTPCTEKLTSVNHCNGVDIWVIVHDWNSMDFKSFLLTSAGVNPVPVVSSVGTFHSVGANFAGCMKTSPNGKKLALAIHSLGQFELYDLDNSTGVVSNSLILHSDPPKFAYGIEFSPDGTKLYGSTGYANGFLYQWDLCAGNTIALISSRYTVFTGTAGIAAMQTASNGKIYAARYNNQQNLGVINAPNLLGAACNYIDLGQSIAPKTTVWSIPNFITSQFKAPFTSTLICSSASFAIPGSAPSGSSCAGSGNIVNNVNWFFGDPLSGSANTSTLNTPTHIFSASGTYTVKLLLGYNCATDTIRQVLTVQIPTLSVSGNLTVCPGNSTTLTASGATSYTWTNFPPGASVVVSPSVSTSYIVLGSISGTSCPAQKTVSVQVTPAPSISVTGKNSICAKEITTLTASGAHTYSWGQSALGPKLAVSPTITSTYSVTGTNTLTGCSSLKMYTVTVSKCTGLADEENLKSILQFYPNPCGDILHLESKSATSVFIFNYLGELLYSSLFDNTQIAIDISNWPQGIYIIRSQSPEGVQVSRLVKNK